MTQHWHILGAGAIGCLWAAHLAKAGHQVTLILRNAEKLALFKQSGGITLENDSGNEQFPVTACIATDCPPIDNLLVTTKAYDTQSALQPVRHAIHPDSQVVVMQNGMGAQQQAAKQLSPSPVWAASTTDGAWLREPFLVVFAGRGETRVGPLSSHELPTIPTAMTPSAELKLLADPAIELSLWRKLAINCAINPLTAHFDCRNGALVEDEEKHQMMAQLCGEIEQVASALKLDLFPHGVLAQAEAVAQATGANYSSMLQDVRNRRQTEIDFITGYLLKQAEQLDLELPLNQQLYLDIRQGIES